MSNSSEISAKRPSWPKALALFAFAVYAPSVGLVVYTLASGTPNHFKAALIVMPSGPGFLLLQVLSVLMRMHGFSEIVSLILGGILSVASVFAFAALGRRGPWALKSSFVFALAGSCLAAVGMYTLIRW